jgi:hypothetical protein
VLRALPAKRYRQLCGRHHKQLADHQRRFGIPCVGSTVDLGAVLTFTLPKKPRRGSADASPA